MTTENLFQALPTDLQHEVFETLVESSETKIERIISSGQSSPESGWYDENKNEWVTILQGSATIAFDNGQRVDLEVGDHLNIPAHTRHRVSRTSSTPPTIWLAVHY